MYKKFIKSKPKQKCLLDTKNIMTIFTASKIMQAYKLARKSRKKKQEVYMFEQNLEYRILKILDDLKNRKYYHLEYKEIILFDSKKRYIFSPQFKDHILHHLVYNEIYDILDRKMVYTTFACRKWFWTQKCILYLRNMIKKEKRRLEKSSFSNYKNIQGAKDPCYNKLYYLKIDFSKYFFSINHSLLKQKIRKYISNEELLYCIDLIIDSYKTPKIYDKLLKENNFYTKEKNKWLPIWWLISQLFANFYLNDLDQFLKHKLKLKFVRYMDDIIIIWTKEKLSLAKKEIFEFIKQEKLILNPKKISFNLVDDWIKFVWYKIKNNKIFVWKRIKKSFLRFYDKLENLEKIRNILTKQDISRLESMYYSRTGFFKISDFWENYIKNLGEISISSWG